MKTFSSFSFVLILVFSSCTKDDNPDLPDNPVITDTIPTAVIDTIPSHWAVNGKNKGDIVYDDLGRVVHVRLYDTPERFDLGHYDNHTEFTFEGTTNKLATARTATWGSLPRNAQYFYGNDEFVDSIAIRTDGGDKRDTIRFKYDFTQDCPLVSYTVVKHDRTTDVIKNFEYLYEYTDAGCSYIKTNFAEGVYAGKFSREFTMNRNFYNPTSFESAALNFLNKNTRSKYCSLEEDGTAKSCTEPIYEYNDEGLVLKYKTINLDGTENVVEYFYK